MYPNTTKKHKVSDHSCQNGDASASLCPGYFSEILHNQIFDIFLENILLRETQTHHRFGCFPIILVQSGDASASLCPGYFSENLHNQIFDFLRKYPIEKDADASPIW